MWQDLKHLRDVCILLLYKSALPIHKSTVSEQTLYSKEKKFNRTFISVNVIVVFFILLDQQIRPGGFSDR